MDALAVDAATLLGATARSAAPLSGGAMGPVLRVVLDDGRAVVAKRGPSPRREAAMLHALAAAVVPTPAVLAVDARTLVLEACPAHGALESAWDDVGTVVARLHAHTHARESGDVREGERYGWEEDDAFGPLAIPNAWSDDWPAFWAERRLLVHAERLPRDLARRVEALAAALPERLPRRPRASLVHGDLWSGNVLVAGTRVSAIIDPAAYLGHGEVDLAMLTLFASPDQRFFAAYEPEPDWHERRPVYQLWHAIVHLLLFGEGYRGMVERLLREAGA